MKIIGLIFVIAVFFSIFVSPVYATFISLTTTADVGTLEGNFSELNVKIQNFGDEAAFNLQVSLISPENFQSSKASLKRLDPNSTFNYTFNITTADKLKDGKYPIVVFVEYADANGYPFSAITPSFINNKNYQESNVFGTIPELTLYGKEKKNLKIELKNFDTKEHSLTINMFLPKEIKSSDNAKSVIINSKEEKSVEFETENFGALVGSNYVVLASIEYDDSLHYSKFAQGFLKIEKENVFMFDDRLLIGIAIALIIIFIYYETRKRKKK